MKAMSQSVPTSCAATVADIHLMKPSFVRPPAREMMTPNQITVSQAAFSESTSFHFTAPEIRR